MCIVDELIVEFKKEYEAHAKETKDAVKKGDYESALKSSVSASTMRWVYETMEYYQENKRMP